jgi:WD40 repeat protein
MFKNGSDWVYAVAWSIDGNMLASAGRDKKVIFWNPASGERLTTLEGHR